MEEMKAIKREKKTQGYLNKMISSGVIPAVCYNSKTDNAILSLDKKDFAAVYKKVGNHIIFNLLVGKGKARKVIVKDVQNDPLLKEPIHVDFYEVLDDIPVKTKVPIILTGESIGIKLGGVLEHKLPKIAIRALPSYLPSAIEVDTSNLNIGDSVYVEDLDIDKNVTVLVKPRQAVCACSHSRVTKMNEDEKDEKDEKKEEAANATAEKSK